MCFLPLKSSHYPSRPVPVPGLFGKYPTRPVPKSKTPTRRTLVTMYSAIIYCFAYIVILVEEFLFGNFKFGVGGLQLLDDLLQVALILLHLRLNLCKTSVQARFETFFERSRISASFLFRIS